MRITLDLDQSASEALVELERLSGMTSARIFSYALSLMLWAFRKRDQGKLVASVDEFGQSYRELDLSALEQKQDLAA